MERFGTFNTEERSDMKLRANVIVAVSLQARRGDMG